MNMVVPMADKQANADDGALEGTEDSLAREEGAMEAIRRAIRGLRFGQVVVIVQDGVVVQVDRTERTRIHRRSRTHEGCQPFRGGPK
jgi:hypothetical protein